MSETLNNTCLVDAFRAAAKASPNATAVTGLQGTLSYAELDHLSDVLAMRLLEMGAKRDKIVALQFERSHEMVVAIWAILKAGAAYLPVATDVPSERLEFMMADADPVCLLTDHLRLGTPANVTSSIVSCAELAGAGPVEGVLPSIGGDQLAYLIYTSGSTGQPKGCLLEHGALRNRVWWMHQTYPIDQHDAVLQKTPYTFDVSVWEFVWPLAVGARLIIARPDGHRDPGYLHDVIAEYRVSVCHFVPSMFRHFLAALKPDKLRSLRHLFFSGEALPYPMMVEGLDKLPFASLHNLYGPTEAAIDVSAFTCTGRPDGIVPIGKPITNISLFTATDKGELTPKGSPGELCIAGDGLARGYLNRPELTEERFPTRTLPDGSRARVYRTGDLALELPDGNFQYIGRLDNQVKLRGNRIELGEIEVALEALEGIQQAVVIVDSTDENDPKLVACYAGQKTFTLPDLRRALAVRLPDYCLPNRLVQMEQIPASTHGKADRKAVMAHCIDGASTPEPVPQQSASDNPEPSTLPGEVQAPDLTAGDILELCRSRLGVPDLSPDQDFLDLGATSFSLLTLGESIDAAAGITIPVEVFLETPTAAAITAFLAEHGRVLGAHGPASGHGTAPPELEALAHAAPEMPALHGSQDANNIAQLLQLCRSTLDLPDLQPEDDFLDLGATSFTLLKLGEAIDQEFDVEIPIDAFLADPSVHGLAVHLPAHQQASAQEDFDANGALSSVAVAKTPSVERQDVIDLPEAKTLEAPDLSKRIVGDPLEGEVLRSLLGVLCPVDVDGHSRYLYPSGGGKNAISVLVWVRAKGCTGLPAGLHRLDTNAKKLDPLVDCKAGAALPEWALCFADAPVGLIFVADLARLRPTYGDLSGLLADLDVGYMTQLLLDHAAGCGLSLAPVDDANFDPSALGLGQDTHIALTMCLGVGMGAAQQDDPIKASLGDAESHGALDRSGEVSSVVPKAALPGVGISIASLVDAERLWRQRSCQRAYLRRMVPFSDLAEFLAPFGRRQSPKTRHLLFVRPGAVETLDEGIYQYRAQGHHLLKVADTGFDALRLGFYPFNRKHFDQSAVVMIILSDRAAARNHAIHGAGRAGQTMMSHQAEIGIGACPIGWINLDPVKELADIKDNEVFVHGFTVGAWDHAKQAASVNDARPSKPDTVSIIGVAARFAACASYQDLSAAFRAGQSHLAPLPLGREKDWGASAADAQARPIGGFLPEIDAFDAGLFSIAGPDARAMDPQERLVLQCAWSCLEDAGYAPMNAGALLGRVGVFVGAMWGDYGVLGQRSDLADGEVMPSAALSSIANRVSQTFGFRGPSLALDAGCASSLTALHEASEAIRHGRCDAALVAGASLAADPSHRALLDRSGLLSTSGSIELFGADSDGWVFGEGVGAILLRRTAEARAAGDNERAVVEATIAEHRGRTRLRAMPSAEAQAEIINNLLQHSGLRPADISVIECAAAGAGLADAAEVSALKRVLDTDHDAVWRLGSSKPIIGHSEAASGIAQIVRVIAQMEDSAMFACASAESPSSLVPLDRNRLFPLYARTPWLQSASVRRGLINGYSAEGVCAHVVLSECQSDASSPVSSDPGPQLLPVSARSDEELRTLAGRLASSFLTLNSVRLSDIAFTLQTGRHAHPIRGYVVASDHEEARNALERLALGETHYDASGNAQLEDLARRWMAGEEIDWLAHSTGRHRRVALPTTAFRSERHWVRQVKEDGQLTRHDATDSAVHESPEQPDENGEAILTWLTGRFAQAVEMREDVLDADAPLDQLGLSSIIIKRVTDDLVAQGVADLRETFWFEVTTLRAAAALLGARFQDQLPLDGRKQFASSLSERKAPAAAAPSKSEKTPAPDAIAVVGMACRFPDADTPSEFWDNLKHGRCAIRDVPADRWDWHAFHADSKGAFGKSYSKVAGWLKDPNAFDPLFFGISPREAETIDPQERLFLETAWSAIEDAGFAPTRLKDVGDVGVFTGVMNDSFERWVADVAPPNDGCQPQVTRFWSIANRVSYALDLSGPSMAIDTACSSSLAAVHLAMRSLRSGECRFAIAGGVNLILHPSSLVARSMLGMLSEDGYCRPLSEHADGTVVAEGCGALLLAPLAQAQAMGCTIYGVLRGSAMNSGGRTNGYTVPNPKAQAGLVRRALEDAAMPMTRVDCIEMHGTGTALGDPVEIDGLVSALSEGGLEDASIALASVKSNIGHAEAAAGIASLIKVLLQLRHRTLVPSLGAEPLNSRIQLAGTPFRVQTKTEDWHPKDGSELCCAGVSSFGAGGANVHVVVEEAARRLANLCDREPQALLLSATGKDELQVLAGQLADCIAGDQDLSLSDIAATLRSGRAAQSWRASIIASTTAEAADRLRALASGGGEARIANISGKAHGTSDQGKAAENLDPQALADAWLDGSITGFPIDMPTGLNRVPLPTTTFRRQHIGYSHVAAGEVVRNETQTFSLGDDIRFLTEHEVGGRQIYSGVHIACAVLAAFSKSEGADPIALQQVRWLRPITQSVAKAGLSIEKTSATSAIVDGGGARFVEFTVSAAHPAGSIDLIDAAGRCSTDLAPEEIYKRAEEAGTIYGPAYRCLRRVQLGSREALALAERSPAAPSIGVIPPGFIDAGLQAAATFMTHRLSEGTAVVPVSAQQFDLIDSVPMRTRIYVSCPDDGDGCNVYYCDDAGTPWLVVSGLKFGGIPSRQGSELVFYRPELFEEILPEAPSARDVRCIWLLDTDDALAQKLSAVLTDVSIVSFNDSLDPACPKNRLEWTDRFTHAAAHASLPDAIVLVNEVNDASESVDVAETLLRPAFYNWIDLVQGLHKANVGARPVLVSINRRRANSRPHPVLTATAGLFRALVAELPALAGLVITTDSDPAEQAQALLAEIAHAAAAQAHEVSWTANVRRRRKLTNCVLPAPAKAMKLSGAQIITGGLGKAARSLVDASLNNDAAKFALIGRRHPSPDERAWLRRHADRVQYFPVDIADFSALAETMGSIRTDMGPLRGVFHVAGLNADRALSEKQACTMSKVLAPKIFGTMALDQLTKDDPLDHFVVFSSVAADQPVSGQADYAFANVAASELVQDRARRTEAGQRSGTSVAIAWPYLAGGGMSADSRLLEHIQSTKGVSPLPIEDISGVLQNLLFAPYPHIGVLPGDRAKIEEHVLPAGRTAPAHRALTEDAADIKLALVGFLTESAAHLLNVDRTLIEPEVELSEFGFDSVFLTQWATKLTETFGWEVLPTEFFDGFTLNRFAERLIADHRDELIAFFGGEAQPETFPAQDISNMDREEVDGAPEEIESVVIAGMACRLPGANDLDAFWDLLISGKTVTEEIPIERWDWRSAKDLETGERFNRFGAFIDDVRRFDGRFFGISPFEAELMDPQQRHLLEVAWHAFEDAGLSVSTLKQERVGVFVGASTHDYGEIVLRSGATASHSSTGTGQAFLANRVSFVFDLKGPSQTVDTACSSSLVALCRAVDAIEAGRCDIALVAGVNLILTPTLHEIFSKAGMLSAQGQCRTFSSEADGYLRGEGIVAVVLMSNAAAAKFRVDRYAKIRSVAENHGGRAQSLTAPNPSSQAALLRMAYASAGLAPLDVDFLECHGTGTVLGDPVEIDGVRSAMEGTVLGGAPLLLGAVKMQIGHLEAAAGLAGVLKAALSLRRQTIPGLPVSGSLNPYLKMDGLEIVEAPRPWDRSLRSGSARRAGVSSFGIGGSNAHAILEEAAPPQRRLPVEDGSEYAFVLSAKTDDALGTMRDRLASWLEHCDVEPAMADVSFTLGSGRERFAKRWAIVASGKEELISSLRDQADAASQRSPDSTKQAQFAASFLSGGDADWEEHHPASHDARVVHIPGYVFAGREYWVDGTDRPSPLSHVPDDSLVKLGSDDPMLAHHVIADLPTLPGMASAVIMGGFGQTRAAEIHLSNVEWIMPVRPGPDGCEIHLRQSSDGRTDLLNADGSTAARARLGEPQDRLPDMSSDALAAIMRTGDPLLPSDLYDRLRRGGLEYGEAFRAIASLGIDPGQRQVVSELRLPPLWREQTKFRHHPALLDGALQSLAALAPQDGSSLPVPRTLDRIDLWEPLPDHLYAIGSVKMSDGQSVSDIRLYAPDGRALGIIKGLRSASMPRGGTNELALLSWDWISSDVEAFQSSAPPQMVLVLDEARDLARSIEAASPGTNVRIASFSGELEGAIHLRDLSRESFVDLLSDCSDEGWWPDLVVHNLARGSFEGGAELEDHLLLGVRSFFALTQALAQTKARRSTRVVYLYPADRPNPAYSAVGAFARTMQREQPDLPVSVVGHAQPTEHVLTQVVLSDRQEIELLLKGSDVRTVKLTRIT